MLPRALIIFVLALGLGASAASSSSKPKSSGSATPSESASSSNSIGTPSNSAALPTLSGVSPCVTNCLAFAAGADGCQSVAAVDCFCPNPKNYTTAFLSCLNACPSEVASAEALVEQFCAAAATSTSLSFASFTPSSSSASASSTSASGSSASATAPTSSGSSSASTTPNAAPALRGQTGLPLLQLGVSAAGVLLGALVVL